MELSQEREYKGKKVQEFVSWSCQKEEFSKNICASETLV
jgi:hypothetical protein